MRGFDTKDTNEAPSSKHDYLECSQRFFVYFLCLLSLAATAPPPAEKKMYFYCTYICEAKDTTVHMYLEVFTK
jgi:hypothetical protein